MSTDADMTPSGAGGAQPRRRLRAHIVPTDERHGVTTLELFFDLVFVFAFTQVTAFMADDLGWRGALRGLVLVALLWFVWCSYTWLGNQARADEGMVRLAMIVAMGPRSSSPSPYRRRGATRGAGSALRWSWP